MALIHTKRSQWLNALRGALRLGSLYQGQHRVRAFEEDIANGLMGAHDDLFKEGKAPANILTCVENADKFFDTEMFGEKKQIKVGF
ncbi:hypothetical protein ABIF07_003579 [Bradyrhizobium elkanii]|uniref:hypothetical protein n=1 Tax=Bradyrhizobium elkanii TaxID=29448 RepID=UPI00216AA3F6|nr:hypothetical protein [Bradyrhizobium elkanii]MCS3689395.1 hypothetical protein [Bradyrhizobium elkanii]